MADVRVRFAGRAVLPRGGLGSGGADVSESARGAVVETWGEGGRRGADVRVPEDDAALAGLHECGQPQCGAGRLRNPLAREHFAAMLAREFLAGGKDRPRAKGWTYASLGSGGALGDWRVLEAIGKVTAGEAGPRHICLVDPIYRLPSPGMEASLGRFAAWFGRSDVRCFWNVEDYADACARDPGLRCDVLCMQDAPALRILVDGADPDLPHGGRAFPARVLRDGGLFAWIHPHGDNAAADVGAKRLVDGSLHLVHTSTHPC